MPKVASSKSLRKSRPSTTPKRPRSAYLLFSMDKRKELQADSPTGTYRATLAELGAYWKAADQQTKQHYQKLADAEKSGRGQQSNTDEQDKENREVNQSMEGNVSQ